MNEEKKIAGAILDAQKIREESYYIPSPDNNPAYGEYKLDMETCLIEACKKHDLSPNFWALLNLAMHWMNDIQLWAEDVLADKNILEECEKENAKMKDEMKQMEYGPVDEEECDNIVVSIEGMLGGKKRKIIFDK